MTDTPATAEKETGPLDALVGRFADVRVRSLLFAGLGGLAMVFVVMFERGSDVGGLLVAVLGAAGLVLGWRRSPVFVLLILLYFLIFPDGLPPPYEDEFELSDGNFRLPDLLLAAALVVYLSAHYRLYGITTQAMPLDAGGYGRKPAPRKRPPDLIRQGELARLFYLTGAVVVVAQIVWAVVTNLEVDVLADFPFRISDVPPRRRDANSDLASWRTRLVAVAGLLFFGALLARLVFGYWRLRRMSPAEGGMVLQDAGWDETRRERTRVETWRKWQAERAKKPGRPGEGGKR
jgi:hypothetical protein